MEDDLKSEIEKRCEAQRQLRDESLRGAQTSASLEGYRAGFWLLLFIVIVLVTARGCG